jgi:hypothetical protein
MRQSDATSGGHRRDHSSVHSCVPGHWLGAARSTTKDFKDLPPSTHETFDEAVAAVVAMVRFAGHTVFGI